MEQWLLMLAAIVLCFYYLCIEMNPSDKPFFERDIDTAVAALQRGEVILYPTDTVWGLGCDSANSDAVKRIFVIKRRSDSKALISLVDSVAMLCRHVDGIPAVALDMILESENPMTVVYDSPVGLAAELLAADGSAGIRVTSERYSAELCRRLGRPVVSTSANISGNPAPAIFDEISPEVIDMVDYCAEYRRDDKSHHNPSSVVKITNDSTVTILRK